MIKKILSKINGLHYPQEYLCLAKESFQQLLHVYLIIDGKVNKDITNDHLLVGYRPLILALPASASKKPHSDANHTELPGNIEIVFSQHSLHTNEFPGKKDAIARLNLQFIKKQIAGDTVIFYYEGTTGDHRFLSSFHQYIIGSYNRLYNKKPGNIFLEGNLYKQVQIAYSIPRIISLITVSDGNAFNLFPTDLHGPVSDQFYVGSLRHEGKACRQVEAARRIVISQVHCDSYKTVYSLGKNHMKDLKPKDQFKFAEASSSYFKLPLPGSVLCYRELELVESFIHEIHKLMLFRIVSQQALSHEPATLAHVHNCYATWRYKHKISSNFLLR